jgi:hypothetical protein
MLEEKEKLISMFKQLFCEESEDLFHGEGD